MSYGGQERVPYEGSDPLADALRGERSALLQFNFRGFFFPGRLARFLL